jgi:lipid-A-disaccharide synthase
MIDAAQILAQAVSGVQFVSAAADEGSAADIGAVLTALKSPVGFMVIGSRTYDLLAAADVAAITSGTATLEAGIIGTPMAIAYKTSRLNYKLLEPLISVPHYGLINLIAGERVAAELIQDDLTPKSLSEELVRLLAPAENAAMRNRLKAAAEKLGHGGASKRAAEAIIRTMDGSV